MMLWMLSVDTGFAISLNFLLKVSVMAWMVGLMMALNAADFWLDQVVCLRVCVCSLMEWFLQFGSNLVYDWVHFSLGWS